MTVFYQAAAAVLLTSILGLSLASHRKEISMVLTITVCCMVLLAAVSFLDPVMEFLHKLETVGNLDSSLIQVLFKTTGIAIISQIAGMVCGDAGNASLGKALQMLATALILWLAIPVFNALLDLIQTILGGI